MHKVKAQLIFGGSLKNLGVTDGRFGGNDNIKNAVLGVFLPGHAKGQDVGSGVLI